MPEKLKILLVDDEPNITKVLKRLLSSKGYEAVEVNDPLKVEEYLLYTDFSLVITDLKMPGLDGLGVLELVKRSKPDTPVLMLTGISTIDAAVQATKLGASEYLTKPIDNESLLKAVKKHISVDQVVPDSVKDAIAGSSLGRDAVLVADPTKLVLTDEILSTETIPDGLVEVKFENIMPGQFLPFGIFVQIFNKKTRRFYLRKLCQENTVFTSGLADILKKRNLGSVYIREEEYASYLEYHNAIKNAPNVMNKARIKDQKKMVLYGKAVEAISDILSEPIDNKNIQSAMDLVDDFFRTIVEDPVTYQDMFRLFKRDTSIFNHSANVCLLAVSFGVYLGLEQKIVNILGFGALFHDVGMNRVERKILEKTAPLTPLEWQEIKKHPERGLALLKGSTLIPVQALRIVLEHHEEEDGSGYPRGLKGAQISHMARLCRLVDKFDGMTTPKPYRAAFTAAEALKRIYFEESNEKVQALIRKFIAFLGGQAKG
jgi:response regulator RpfG family c-di-GMP phosphodiesterase